MRQCQQEMNEAPEGASNSPRRASRMLLDQLDLIPIRIFNKRDHRRSAFHRTGFARDLATRLADTIASCRGVVYFQRNVPIGGTQVVLAGATVGGQSDHPV